MGEEKFSSLSRLRERVRERVILKIYLTVSRAGYKRGKQLNL